MFESKQVFTTTNFCVSPQLHNAPMQEFWRNLSLFVSFFLLVAVAVFFFFFVLNFCTKSHKPTNSHNHNTRTNTERHIDTLIITHFKCTTERLICNCIEKQKRKKKSETNNILSMLNMFHKFSLYTITFIFNETDKLTTTLIYLSSNRLLDLIMIYTSIFFSSLIAMHSAISQNLRIWYLKKTQLTKETDQKYRFESNRRKNHFICIWIIGLAKNAKTHLQEKWIFWKSFLYPKHKSHRSSSEAWHGSWIGNMKEWKREKNPMWNGISQMKCEKKNKSERIEYHAV